MYGDYPQIMKDIVGHRLPKFTDAQKAKLKNSADFVGLNYYTSVFSNHLEKPDPSKPRWMQDSLINWESKFKNGYFRRKSDNILSIFDYFLVVLVLIKMYLNYFQVRMLKTSALVVRYAF